MNIAVPGASVRVIGTPFKNTDLYGYLKENPGFVVTEYPIISPTGQLLWEGRHDLEGIMEKLVLQGSLTFSREMLCRPITSGASIFPDMLIKMCDDASFTMFNNAASANNRLDLDFIVMGADFAISANVGADYTVFTTLGVKCRDIDTCRIYLLHTWVKKGATYKEQMDMLDNLNRRFNYKLICAEDNVFQQLYVQVGKDRKLPMFGHTTGTNKYSLKEGVPSLAVIMEQLRFRMPSANKESIEMSKVVASSLSSIAYTDKGLCSVASNLEDDSTMSLWKGIVAVREAFTGVFQFGFA